MKIRDFQSAEWLPQTNAAQPSAAVRSPEQVNFREVLRDQYQGSAAERLSALAEDIQKQGRIVAERKDIMELKRYKKLVQEFMHEAVDASFSFQKKNTRDGRGRHRVYAVIKRLNESLEELTQKVLSEEADNLQLMASIDDINGMLVDLLV